ncbi:P-loop containing nucleoside triphosphate hydrolase protein, partial [Jimgerdemannia flammicorona]
WVFQIVSGLHNSDSSQDVCIAISYCARGKWGESVENVQHAALTWYMSSHTNDKLNGEFVFEPDRGLNVAADNSLHFNLLPKPGEYVFGPYRDRYVLRMGFISNTPEYPENRGSRVEQPPLPPIRIACTNSGKSLTVGELRKIIEEITSQYLDVQKELQATTRMRFEYDASSASWMSMNTLPTTGGLEYIALSEENERRLKEGLKSFKENKELILRLGSPYRYGILLYGDPGTGKSSVIYAIASSLLRSIYMCDLRSFRSDSELKAAFSKIPKDSIIAFEDIDTQSYIVQQRVEQQRQQIDNEIGNERTLSFLQPIALAALLEVLDGRFLNEGNIFIITTNFKNKLDKAITRLGRMDLQLEFGKCTHYQIQHMYKIVVEDKDAEISNLAEIVGENVLTPCEVKDVFMTNRSNLGEVLNTLRELASSFECSK